MFINSTEIIFESIKPYLTIGLFGIVFVCGMICIAKLEIKNLALTLIAGAVLMYFIYQPFKLLDLAEFSINKIENVGKDIEKKVDEAKKGEKNNVR